MYITDNYVRISGILDPRIQQGSKNMFASLDTHQLVFTIERGQDASIRIRSMRGRKRVKESLKYSLKLDHYTLRYHDDLFYRHGIDGNGNFEVKIKKKDHMEDPFWYDIIITKSCGGPGFHFNKP